MISFISRTDAVAEISSSTTGFAPGASCSFKSMQRRGEIFNGDDVGVKK